MQSIAEMYRDDIQTFKGALSVLSNCMGDACIDRIWWHIVVEITATASRDPNITPEELVMLQTECIRG